MKKLIHANRVPYGGGYVINQPKIGMCGKGTTLETLAKNVIAYRKANGFPIGLGFRDELEALVCSEYPSECKETDPSVLPEKPIKLRLNDVIAGTRTMIAFIAAGRPIVSEEEANRRADICASCRYNIPFPRTCGGNCGPLKEIVLQIVGKRETRRHADLNACQICKCFLQASVWLPLDLQVKALGDAQRTQFSKIPWCWKQ